jgi:hypothetical protein
MTKRLKKTLKKLLDKINPPLISRDGKKILKSDPNAGYIIVNSVIDMVDKGDKTFD